MKRYIIFILLLSLVSGCGSKKSVSQSEKKEKTDISLVDSSTIVKNIEQEKQFIDTRTKERIVTYYGMQLVPYPINGDTVYIPVSYPIQKEEERDTQEQSELWKTKVQDSIRNSIDLKYRNDLKEKEKKILEFKESTIIWQITALSGLIITILFIVLYTVNKRKLKKLL